MDRIKFSVNGVNCTVGKEVSSDVTLLNYIRETLELRGTKYMCLEGGCGACIVSVITGPDQQPQAVNSCLVSITSCDGWEITTVEKVGNKFHGYNPIQKTLAINNGTQCGYCTPGWVMAMYSLLKSKQSLTMLEIEQSFGSNICRCTGYRPILDAFKKFATDSPDPLPDIEDLNICIKSEKKCIRKTKTSSIDDDWCIINEEEMKSISMIEIRLSDGKLWYTARSLNDILILFNFCNVDDYMLVAGNTAKGVYPIEEYPSVLIDISKVTELKHHIIDQNLVVGAGHTLTEFLNILEQQSHEEYFGYLNKLHEHILLVAHIAVRNIGTIAGNLMIKHKHTDFPSDLFLLFEAVGAEVTIMDKSKQLTIYSMRQFLTIDMNKKIVLNILLPPLSEHYNLVTFKIMPRAQNAHAIVNAGFLYKLDENNRVIESRIVYGGLSATFIRAITTEKFLKRKVLFQNETLQNGLKVLQKEMIVTDMPPEPSVIYREKLALGLFYKGLLTLCPSKLMSNRFLSGATNIHKTRPVSQGHQFYKTDPALYPLNKPVPKVEALIQCSGEAPYIDDLPKFPHEVFAAFVLSKIASGEIANIDPTKALAEPGVIAFLTAKDIPGLNTFSSGFMQLDFINNEEILSSGKIKYYNQPIGIIVAETQYVAQKAAKMVRIKYNSITEPVLKIKEAIKHPNRVVLYKSVPRTENGGDVKKTITGTLVGHGQYHFSMETLVCVTRPIEEGLEVYPASQWLDGIQNNLSKVLKMDASRIDVHARRLGGAYGIKISRVSQVAMACALVTYKINRPCRFITPLTTVTKCMGKRLPYISQYEAKVNDKGAIQSINHKTYEDYGHTVTEGLLCELTFGVLHNCYKRARWNYDIYTVLTDLPKNTWCRAPGTLGAIATTEWIMEKISYEMSLDPLEVRLANLDEKYTSMKEVIETLKSNSEYEKRKLIINKYNNDNRWKKKGLRFSLSLWTPAGSGTFEVTLNVYHADGSISIVHGGCEMGQGLNTKVVQVCSYLLKVPMDKIQVKANNTVVAPNCFISGGSLASNNTIVGTQRACNELLSRLQPIRSKMTNPTWNELILEAFTSNVDLQVHGFVGTDVMNVYDIYGAALVEVEIDLLTGESEVLRADILQDVGQSASPGVDVGQVEGAFIMGLGHWTVENLVYDDKGDLLTNRTWNYHVPQARDIPQDIRVYFRENSYSDAIFLGGKGTGEPPICLSVCVPIAMREAIAAARLESGICTTEWFDIDGPYTVEKVCLASSTKIEDFKFN